MNTTSGLSADPDRELAQTEAELTSRLTTAISRISRRIRVRSHTMSYGLLSALATIKRIGPLRPGDLATAERVTRPTITRMVAALESKGFISRDDDPDDGRAFVIAITPAGSRALQDARAERAEDLAGLMDVLSPVEARSLYAALPALEKIALTDYSD